MTFGLVLTIHNCIIIIPKDSPPPSLNTNCSIFLSSGSPTVQLQWSSIFTEKYAVENYQVTISPSIPSCFMEVEPNEDYSCSGLELDKNYSITFRAMNCNRGNLSSYSFQLSSKY